MMAFDKVVIRLLVGFLLALALASPAAAQGLRLHILAVTGTAQEVQDALKTGANFNDSDVTGVTALMAAAGNNHDPAVVQVLMRSGAVVDARDGLLQFLP